jgi:hypothetical protein
MKYLFLLPLLALTFALAWVAPAYAQTNVLDPVCNTTNIKNEKPAICKDDATNKPDNQNPILGPNGVLGRVVNILSIIGGIMAVITIMIAGTRIIVSAGDSATIASSRQAILYAVFGLIIILLSQIMVRFVISKL